MGCICRQHYCEMQKPCRPTYSIVAEQITHPDPATHIHTHTQKMHWPSEGQIHIQWSNMWEIIVLSLKGKDASINTSHLEETDRQGMDDNKHPTLERMDCPLFSASSVIMTNAGFLLSNPNNMGIMKQRLGHTHTVLRQFFKNPLTTWELASKG